MRVSRLSDKASTIELKSQRRVFWECARVAAVLLVVCLVGSFLFAAPQRADASVNCLSPRENNGDCRIPPRFEGISAATYGEKAYICARSGETGSFLWIKDYGGFPNLRTCIDFELIQVNRNPVGRIKYARDFYVHYGVEAREWNRQINYITGLVRYLAAVGDASRIIATPLFCRAVGVAGAGPVGSIACSYVISYLVLINQPH
jgi:hypothetical protein